MAHVALEVCPVSALQVPPGHLVQAVRPAVAPYVPSGHVVHGEEPVALYCPAGQWVEQVPKLKTPSECRQRRMTIGS